jgi:hypothetical protein
MRVQLDAILEEPQRPQPVNQRCDQYAAAEGTASPRGPRQQARDAFDSYMIVRNEAHVLQEMLDSVAPYISSW